MGWCSSGATTSMACWPRSSAVSCGWLADRDRGPVEQRQLVAQPDRKRLDDRRARLVPEGRQEQQRRADDQGRQRDVELDRTELPEERTERVKDVSQRRDEQRAAVDRKRGDS